MTATRKRAHAPSAKLPAEPAPLPTVPHNWTPRHYQQRALDQFDRGIRRQMLIWHRRAGKDSFALNLSAIQSQAAVGSYWHLFPLHVQAKRAIWRGLDNEGRKFIDQAFPPPLRADVNNTDMFIEFKNGSTWQLVGSDYYDRLVGANVLGVVFSEWALCDPRAWDYVRPIIRANNGWAVFISTYRGRNHCYQMAQRLKGNPDWYVDIRDITQTSKADGSPVLSAADIEAERAEGMSEAMIRQEYFCDPMAAPEGSVYGHVMGRLLEHSTAGLCS